MIPEQEIVPTPELTCQKGAFGDDFKGYNNTEISNTLCCWDGGSL